MPPERLRPRFAFPALWLLGAAWLAALAVPSRAHAQTVAPDFYITNGPVTAQVVRDSTLYMGGSFSFVGPVTGAGLTVDSASAVPTAGFPHVNGTVLTAIPDSTGGWFIGGQFTAVGTSARSNLAHVLADLSVSPWDPGANGVVRTLAMSGGVVYAGGDFLTLGGVTRNRIGGVDAASGVTAAWNPNADGSVRALAVGNGVLYVGGQFTNIGGLPRNRIAMLSLVTAAANPNWDTNANGPVLALWLDPLANVLYAGGQFTFLDGQTRNRIAQLEAGTGLATVWNSGSNNAVFAIVASGNRVYVAGQFTNIGSQPRNRIAALDANTALATPWNPSADNIVQALALSGTTLYAGGDFLSIGGQSRSRIAALDTGTGLATPWNPSSFGTLSVLGTSGGQVFAGGSFSGLGGTPRNNLAAFDLRTGLVTPWAPEADSMVQALVLTPTQMIAGGNFTRMGGQLRSKLAAVDLNLGLPSAWAPNCNGAVSALALAGQRLYVGGLFTSLGGQPRSNLGAVDVNSGLAHAWIADADDQVLALDAGTGPVYVGGNFLTLGGQPRSFIAAADSATAAVTPWAPEANASVRSIVPGCDRIYVGGSFTSIGGQVRNHIASLDPASALALAWDPDANGTVFSVLPQSGVVYLGGVMSAVGGLTRNRVAAVDPFTGAVSPWNANSNGTVRSLAANANQLFIGGVFSSLTGVPSGNVAAVSVDASNPCPVISLTLPPLPATVAGTVYAATVEAAGGIAPYCYSITAGALPAGITLDAVTGQLSGSATSPRSASFAFTLTATDWHGCTGTADYAIDVTGVGGLEFVVQPANVAAGANLTPAVQVKVIDAQGVPLSGTTVVLALQGTGALSGGSAISNASGIATFSTLHATLVGSKRLVATSGVMPPAPSVAFTVSPGPAAVLSFTAQPSNVVAGITLAPPVLVKVADAFGNVVAGTSVSLALVGTGTLTGGGAQLSDAAGIATFAALSVNLAGAKQLSATSGVLPAATSTAFTVSAGPAAALSFTIQPANVVAGVAIAPAVQVKVADTFGNPVAGTSVTLALVGTGALSGGGAVVSNATGIASFATLSVNLAGAKQLTASSGALPPATSSAFTVSAAAAATLAFAVQPSNVIAGAADAPPVQVSVVDAFGNAVAGSSVTLALVGTGTLSGGGAHVSDAAGIATFNALSVNLVGAKQLRATSGALPAVTSSAFTVSAAAAATLSFAVQPSNVVAGVAVAPAVQVKVVDAFGNVVAGSPVALALVGTGTLSGGAAHVSDTTGIATFTTLSVDLAGAKQLTASSGALPTATSTAFTVTHGPAAALSFSVEPANVVAGVSLAPAVQVKVADVFGNGISGSSVTLALVGTGTLTGGGAALSNASGIASFAALSVNFAGSKQLTATSGVLPAATSTAFTVAPAAAATLSFSVQPSNVVAGVAVAPAVHVTVADAFGNGVPGTSVALALVGTGTLSGGGAVVSNASGVASFATLSVNLVGSKQLTASSGVLPAVTSSAFTVAAAPAAALSFTVQPANVIAGANVAPAVQVKVADAFGNAVAGSSVALALVGSGTLTGGGAHVSDAAGITTFNALSVDLAGAKQLTATSGALPSATSTAFTVAPGPATTLSFSVQPSNVVAGVVIAPAVHVKVADAFGNGVAGSSVALSLVGSGTLGGGAAVVSNATGIASFAALSVNLAGSRQLTASSGALSPVTSTAFTVSAAAAAALSLTTQPSNVVAGVSMTPAVQVKVADTFGNVVAGAPVTVSLVGTGTLSGGSAHVSDAAGLATFNALSVDLVGSKQLTASSGALPTVTSGSFAVSAAAAAALSFSTQPSTIVAGVVMAPAVQVKVEDAFGNAIAGTSVALALVGNGTLTGGAGKVSDSGGIASFAGLSVDASGSKQLSASSGALPAATSDAFTVSAAAPAALSFSVQPGNVVAGVAIAPQVRVTVSDTFGNGVPDASVALALIGTGTLSGGAAHLSDAEGIAAFDALSVNLVGAKQLSATSGVLAPATSIPFTVANAPAASLTFTTQPANVAAGATVAPAVQVSVADAFGNSVAGAPVALALVGTGTLSGGAAQLSDAGGIATFNSLSVDLAGSKQLSASSGAVTPQASSTFTVSPGAAATLSFVVSPSDVAAGATLAPAVQVQVVDAFGNAVSGTSVALTLVGTGTLSGGAAQLSDAAGLATFDILSLNLAGAKQLTATSGVLTPVTSTSFTVSAAAAATLSFSTQPSGVIAGASIAPAVRVQVADAFGNAVAGSPIALSLLGTGTLSGGAAVVSDASGIAAFPTLSVNVAGAKQLAATSGALPPATSSSFVVSASAAATLAFTVQPANVVAGATLAPAVQVRVADAFGNGVSGSAVALALVGNGTLSGSGVVVSNATGVASFSSLSVNLAGAKQLTASSGTLAPVTSNAFTVSAGTAVAILFTAQPPNVVAGATLAPSVQVKVADALGNGVAGSPVALALVGNGTLTGGAAVASNANGIAIFPALSVNLVGSKQLTATSGALPVATSAAFTVLHAAATTLTFTVQPSNVLAGATIAPAVQVRVTDPFGNTASGLLVSLALVGNGTLTGGGVVPSDASGIASFPALKVDRSGAKQLRASCAALPVATSAAFTVDCPALTLAPPALPSAGVGRAYSQAFTASGGLAPYTFTISAGTLPAGFSLSASGLLSGTTSASGIAQFTVTGTDARGCGVALPCTLSVEGVPAAVSDLGATCTAQPGTAPGTRLIRLAFATKPFTSTVEVYRAAFGGYPRYDDAGGHTPPTPGYPPAAPWVLTPVTASGQSDAPPGRDAWSYVVFQKNAVGQTSAVSNQTPVTPDYLLGDFATGTATGAGDNVVDFADVSLLGAHYGISGTAITAAGVSWLDIGPTTDRTALTRPVTDGRIDFEDLIVLVGNYSGFASPAALTAAAEGMARAAQAPEHVELDAPAQVGAGQTFAAVLRMRAEGRVQGLSAQLAWDAAIAEPVSVTRGGWVKGQDGVVFSARAGNIDAALLGIREQGFSGEGDVATVTFRALRAGDPGVRIATLEARDVANRKLAPGVLEFATPSVIPAQTLLLAPSPNPARGPANVSFALAQPGRVELAIYSVDGRRLRVLAAGEMAAGLYHFTWSGDDDHQRKVAPGIYFAQLVTPGRRFSRKLVSLQ